jgi:hypothetical protein
VPPTTAAPAVAVEQGQRDIDAHRLHAALQFQPRHRVALDRGGEVEQRAGGRRQAEIQHGADLAVAPQQVGDMPVVVRPQPWLGAQALGQAGVPRQHVALQLRFPWNAREIAGQPGTFMQSALMAAIGSSARIRSSRATSRWVLRWGAW